MHAAQRLMLFFLANLVLQPLGNAQSSETFKDCSECPQMVIVPAGTFMMGSTRDETDREKVPKKFREVIFEEFANFERPRHEVTVKKFAIGQYPVMRSEFAAFVRDTVESPLGCESAYIENGVDRGWRNPGFEQTDQHPVVCVSGADVKLYLEWLNRKTGKFYRLPSEAEWEYAARGGTTTARFWGDDPNRACEFANVADLTTAGPLKRERESLVACRDGYVYTSPVGSFRPNPFGLYDMLGNVEQRVQDCFHDDYKGAPSDESPWTTQCRKNSGSGFVMSYPASRGSSWANRPEFVRSAARGYLARDKKDTLGFRVALTLDAIGPKPPTSPPPNCEEAELHWKSAEEVKTRRAYEAHIARYPDCPFAVLARARLQALPK
jgi:formylglycine-generating enzyme required for sulfatase activity